MTTLLDKYISKIEETGLICTRKYAPLNMDIHVVTFTDRCRLVNKQQFFIDVAFSGSDILQGIYYLEHKIKLIIANYNKSVKDFGGFERADIFI